MIVAFAAHTVCKPLGGDNARCMFGSSISNICVSVLLGISTLVLAILFGLPQYMLIACVGVAVCLSEFTKSTGISA